MSTPHRRRKRASEVAGTALLCPFGPVGSCRVQSHKWSWELGQNEHWEGRNIVLVWAIFASSLPCAQPAIAKHSHQVERFLFGIIQNGLIRCLYAALTPISSVMLPVDAEFGAFSV